ncbi:MAG: plastocyanin/azurin family copper-binding protein [Longimicrobiales bacterium]|nr:plastocyanin/azurin family copper-binding protein [Longimicrobiales bacterium]
MSLFTALAVLVAAACGDDSDNGGTDPQTTGTVSVTVRADGSARAGVQVQLFSPGATSATATVTTNSNGIASFSSVEEGSWEVAVVVPEGLALADGEEGRKTVSVVAGQTTSSSFSLTDVFEGVTVDATGGLDFVPSNVTISAGTAVRWINTSTVLHTVTPDGHSEWDSATLADEGDQFVHTFSTPGTYAYFCQPHVGQGMTGTIVVN